MSMMEFEGRDELMQRLAVNGTMQRQLALYQQYALAMTQKYEPENAPALMAGITGDASIAAPQRKKAEARRIDRVERARVSAAGAALPGGA